MSPPLREETFRELISIVERLGSKASFRRILFEANARGVLSWHRTLRRYLDLLVLGEVLRVREKDVGSVNPRQTYTLISKAPRLWTGSKVLQLEGLNWEIADNDLYQVKVDLSALARARLLKMDGRRILATCVEDALVYNLKRDLEEETGGIELVAGMLATRPVDLSYLLRRADALRIGEVVRSLMERLIEIFTGKVGDAEAKTFMETRKRFLTIAKTYRERGLIQLLDRHARRKSQVRIVAGLSPAQIVSAAGKQLGVSG